MEATESNPFKAHADWEHNACIDNFMQFAELARCYFRSGDALVASAANDHSLLDVHIYSICFLYRHGLELILKDLLWKSDYALTGVKRFSQHHKDWQELGRHRLQHLWDRVYSQAMEILAADFPINADQLRHVKKLFGQIEEHDPDSFAFRYPIGKKMGRTHPSLIHVNVRVLYERVHQTIDHLAALAELIGYHYDQRSEYERAMTE